MIEGRSVISRGPVKKEQGDDRKGRMGASLGDMSVGISVVVVTCLLTFATVHWTVYKLYRSTFIVFKLYLSNVLKCVLRGKQTLPGNTILLNSFYKTNIILIPKLDEGIKSSQYLGVSLLLASDHERTALFKCWKTQVLSAEKRKFRWNKTVMGTS